MVHNQGVRDCQRWRSLSGHKRDHGDVICLPEAESGFGDDRGRQGTEAGGAFEAEEFTTRSGLRDAVGKEGETVAANDLKSLFRKCGIRVEPEWQRGRADQLLTIEIGCKMAAVGEGEDP